MSKNRVHCYVISQIFLRLRRALQRLRRAQTHLISDPSHVHVWYGSQVGVRVPTTV